MNILKSLFLVALLGFVATANSQEQNENERGFQLAFTGTAVLGDGTEVTVNYPLAFEQRNGIWHFRAGSQAVAMSSPPQSYNLQLAVLEADSMVYIQEFANRYMRSFSVEIGEHKLVLEPSLANVLFGIRVAIDDNALIFEKRTPSIKFELDETGIVDITSDGFVRDLSSRRVE
ncbi:MULTISPECIES: hypothetical protein [Gammaproteobacteria]|uniref:hypothetical protein n=1 Tax=Gammaproteobacteria TaxID=1236 RepID=UPI000DD02EAD|nr:MULTISPECIES: hypothetical protein [Gammaproteobacteria]RTE87525.1 hypothetical protein DQX04_03875 [Aliidiomarina sp. B3213]TCZ92690.1 hypothetical protein EYQ95_01430 [Lysobacter sp. N42]